MNVMYINPFLDSVMNVLKTMTSTEATPKKPFVKTDEKSHGDVSGLIGCVGDKTKGSFAISFTEPCIIGIVNRMLMESYEKINEQIVDAVGEITNMVSGGARKILSEQGLKLNMAIPTMIVGQQHEIQHKTQAPVIVLPFETDIGPFFVEVSLEDNRGDENGDEN
jgi:chemotaxis protein CheX